MGWFQQIKNLLEAPTADSTTGTYLNETLGNKSDAAATGAVTTTDSIMAYTKQLVTDVRTIDDFLDTEVAAILANTGALTDAAVYAVGTDKTLQQYVKGLLNSAPRTATSASATALTNGATLFTITGGPIVIEYLASICIATGDGGAATLQYSADPTVGSAATISGATGSLATAVAGSMVVFIGTALDTAPTFLTTGHGVIATGPSRIAINEGIITSVVGGAASTATWKHYIRYSPLTSGVTVA